MGGAGVCVPRTMDSATRCVSVSFRIGTDRTRNDRRSIRTGRVIMSAAYGPPGCEATDDLEATDDTEDLEDTDDTDDLEATGDTAYDSEASRPPATPHTTARPRGHRRHRIRQRGLEATGDTAYDQPGP